MEEFTIMEYNSITFVKLLEALMQEFITETEGGVECITLHLPESWENSKTINVEGIPYFCDTENTLEVEINWTDEKTKTLVNFIGIRMRAP